MHLSHHPLPHTLLSIMHLANLTPEYIMVNDEIIQLQRRKVWQCLAYNAQCMNLFHYKVILPKGGYLPPLPLVKFGQITL